MRRLKGFCRRVAGLARPLIKDLRTMASSPHPPDGLKVLCPTGPRQDQAGSALDPGWPALPCLLYKCCPSLAHSPSWEGCPSHPSTLPILIHVSSSILVFSIYTRDLAHELVHG